LTLIVVLTTLSHYRASVWYTCTKFGVDSSSRFPVTARTNRQTDRQTRLNALPTPAAMPACVMNVYCLFSALYVYVITKSWMPITATHKTVQCRALTHHLLQAQNWNDEVPRPTAILSSLDTARQQMSRAAERAALQHRDRGHQEPSSHQHSSTVEKIKLRIQDKLATQTVFTVQYTNQTLFQLLTR